MNLWFGNQEFAARLEAIVDFAQEPLLIRHFMDHHHCQGKVNRLIDAEPICSHL